MLRDLTRGIVRENPIFVTMLGLCPSLAITTHLSNGIGLGVALTIVLILSGVTVSLLREIVPVRIRTPIYLSVIAVYVTVIEVLMDLYLPTLREQLGIFVPLMVVNCIVLARADAFARYAVPGRAALDALGMGVGFLLGLSLIALVREVLGAGTITLFPIGEFEGVILIPGLSESPVGAIGLAAGAFFVVGYLRALFVWLGSLRTCDSSESNVDSREDG